MTRKTALHKAIEQLKGIEGNEEADALAKQAVGI